MVENPPASAGDVRPLGSTPGLGRSPGGGNGNPLQYSLLGESCGQRSPTGYVLGVSRSRTQLSEIVHMHLHKALGPCTGMGPEDPGPCFSLYLD